MANYDQYEKYGVGQIAVIDKVTLKLIGWSGLKYSLDKNEYDIGLGFTKVIGIKDLRLKLQKSLDFGFSKLKIEKIVDRAMKENIGSIKVLEKTGMIFKEIFEFDGHQGVIYEL